MTAHYEPSHLDLYCLHRYLFWSAGMKELMLYPKLHLFFLFRRFSWIGEILFLSFSFLHLNSSPAEWDMSYLANIVDPDQLAY